jgi:hypothetical protein
MRSRTKRAWIQLHEFTGYGMQCSRQLIVPSQGGSANAKEAGLMLVRILVMPLLDGW